MIIGISKLEVVLVVQVLLSTTTVHDNHGLAVDTYVSRYVNTKISLSTNTEGLPVRTIVQVGWTRLWFDGKDVVDVEGRHEASRVQCAWGGVGVLALLGRVVCSVGQTVTQ